MNSNFFPPYRGYQIELREGEIAYRVNGVLTTKPTLNGVKAYIDELIKRTKDEQTNN